MGTEEFRQTRSARKHAAILQAAGDLFRRDGYARASMEEIAGTAEVSTATLYRHFPSKAALFEAVAVTSLERLETALPTGEVSPMRALRSLVRAYADLLSEPETRAIMRMLIAETGKGGDLADMFYERIKSRVGEVFGAAIHACIQAGEVEAADDLGHLGGQLQGMIEHGCLMRGLVLGDDVDTLKPPHWIADKALETWLARWGR